MKWRIIRRVVLVIVVHQKLEVTGRGVTHVKWMSQHMEWKEASGHTRGGGSFNGTKSPRIWDNTHALFART